MPSEKSAERGNNKARAREREREREEISLWSSARQSKKLKVCGLGFAILVSFAPFPDCIGQIWFLNFEICAIWEKFTILNKALYDVLYLFIMDNKQLSSLTNVWFAFDINYFKEY